MNRRVAFTVLLLTLCGAGTAWAQISPGNPGAVGQASASSSPADPRQDSERPQADPARVKELADTLNDPDARAKLIQQLYMLADADSREKPDDSEEVGTRVVRFLSGQVAEASQEFAALGRAFAGLPVAETWLRLQVADPNRRARWVQLGSTLATMLAAGAATLLLSVAATRNPRRAVERHTESGGLRRLLAALAHFLLGLAPIGLFAGVTYAILPVLDLPATIRIAAVTLLDATILAMTLWELSGLVFAPDLPNLRLVNLGDAPARSAHRWLCRIGAVVVFGSFGISAAMIFGLPAVAGHAAFKIVGFTLTVMLIALTLRLRRPVAGWIRGDGRADHREAARQASAFWSTRRRLSDVWHLLVIVYLIVIFAIWALNLRGGFIFLLRGTLASVLLLAVARFAIRLIERAAEHGLRAAYAADIDLPHFQERVDRYVGVARASTSFLIWVFVLLALVEVWGAHALAWFELPTGRLILAKAASIVLVMASAFVAWEFVSALIERYLVGHMRDGTAVERSQRVRTLLPLLRNAFLIFLIVLVALLVLSEIGLDIAPLLAGAGVVGLAIGFGAQTLVKDVITGILILFENTIAIGDVVDVGGGHSGLVEGISIRTIRMRDNSGAVHTVPFSNVSSVVNLTKDFAFYMFNIKVDYRQDTDRVVDVVKTLGEELQADSVYGPLILAPIEIFGVDSFGSDAVVVQARFKTRPIKQWAVGREFNRRLKKRFDELSIPLSFPQSMVMMPGGAGDFVGGAVQSSDPGVPGASGPAASMTATATA